METICMKISSIIKLLSFSFTSIKALLKTKIIINL